MIRVEIRIDAHTLQGWVFVGEGRAFEQALLNALKCWHDHEVETEARGG